MPRTPFVPSSLQELQAMRAPVVSPSVVHTTTVTTHQGAPYLVHQHSEQPTVTTTTTTTVSTPFHGPSVCLYSPYCCNAHRPLQHWCAHCLRTRLFPEYHPPVTCLVPQVPVSCCPIPSCQLPQTVCAVQPPATCAPPPDPAEGRAD